MTTLRRKLRQIWAVLKWDDAIVYQKKSLDAFVLGLMPPVYGIQGSPMTCKICGAEWDINGPVTYPDGHHQFCAGYKINKFIAG